MNSSQVRAKARAAMLRREDEVEEEEIQGGEINLVPYLDIVTNLMLFILVSVSAGFILGQINTTLPDAAPASSVPPKDPNVLDRTFGSFTDYKLTGANQVWLAMSMLGLSAFRTRDYVLDGSAVEDQGFLARVVPERVQLLIIGAGPSKQRAIASKRSRYLAQWCG